MPHHTSARRFFPAAQARVSGSTEFCWWDVGSQHAARLVLQQLCALAAVPIAVVSMTSMFVRLLLMAWLNASQSV